MKVLFAAAEAAPLAKVGGLGDVVGSLPKVLSQLGVDARIILPHYKNVDDVLYPQTPFGTLAVDFGGKKYRVQVTQTRLPGSMAVVYLLKEPEFFGRHGVYESPTAAPGGIFEIRKFLFYCQTVLSFLETSEWQPDILHCHDWHVAALALLFKVNPRLAHLPAILTIHNLAMQGRVSFKDFQPLLGEEAANLAKAAIKADQVNLLKLGILYSRLITTVSPQYAQEILTDEFGQGLEEELNQRAPILGILNGIDVDVWNPQTDRLIAANYDLDQLDKKSANKLVLQKRLGLKTDLGVCLVGVVSRLTAQKGFDLLLPFKEQLKQLPVQLAVLGIGEPAVEDFFSQLKAEKPQQIATIHQFDESLAHAIYAGADMFLMPSRFEPCGLGQMIAMRYGTLPLVRAVGGLKDTVQAFNPQQADQPARGFVFTAYESQELLKTLMQAVELYQKQPQVWQQLQRSAMNADFSWQHSAREYLKAYQRALAC